MACSAHSAIIDQQLANLDLQFPLVTGIKKGVIVSNIYRPAKRVTFCRVCPTDFLQGTLSADFASDDLKVKSVYVVDDAEIYGVGVAKLFKKRCGLQALIVGLVCPNCETVADCLQANIVGIMHRAAAPDRKAIAIDPDHVDIARPQSHALLQNARALVDHGENQPLDNLLTLDRSPRDAEPFRCR